MPSTTGYSDGQGTLWMLTAAIHLVPGQCHIMMFGAQQVYVGMAGGMVQLYDMRHTQAAVLELALDKPQPVHTITNIVGGMLYMGSTGGVWQRSILQEIILVKPSICCITPADEHVRPGLGFALDSGSTCTLVSAGC